VELNLGAVGKGYALDRVALFLREQWGVASALLHAGGSSVYAIGQPPWERRGWPIRLQHPFHPEQALGTIWLQNQGLGTSAATYQFFLYKNKQLGHLLDPRTGWPAAGTAAASVTASTAAEADAYSTATFVLGSARTEKLALRKPNMGFVLLSHSAADETPVKCPTDLPELRTFNLTPESYSPPE
jgi:thiamine biosynthesis lipoprotein